MLAVSAAVLLIAGCASEEKAAVPEVAKEATEVMEAVAAPTAEAVIAAQLDAYPMNTCPISGEELGSMGDPYNHVANGRLVRFCCDGCIPDFEKDVAAAMAKVDAAYAAAGVPVPDVAGS